MIAMLFQSMRKSARTAILLASLAVVASHAQSQPAPAVAPPLYKAAESGDLAEVQRLIEQDASPNTLGPGKQSIIQVAAERCNLEVVKYLAEKGAELNHKNASTRTPLVSAILGGDIRIVQVIFEKGVDIETKMDVGVTALHAVAMRGEDRIDLFELLLKNGAKVDTNAEGGNTTLMFATMSENVKIMKKIIELRPNMVSSRATYGGTACSLAQARQSEKSKEIAEMLKQASAGR